MGEIEDRELRITDIGDWGSGRKEKVTARNQQPLLRKILAERLVPNARVHCLQMTASFASFQFVLSCGSVTPCNH
ncbi:MAG: hypothetical protein BJ554DRAFT_5880 [Olpidium bornovanus]|uniref:Uncharacterized protein n=1 Tax=Olpidium bornovanus TaxID=278681 RepID=A0A8H7ZYV5_9FUNG|nr:MAG: hypothetical protein BJ554DRAFT_5880 [Olpidium bornovanus]